MEYLEQVEWLPVFAICTVVFTVIVHVLSTLGNWYGWEIKLHRLRIEAHSLRLRAKHELARQNYVEMVMQSQREDERREAILEEENEKPEPLADAA